MYLLLAGTQNHAAKTMLHAQMPKIMLHAQMPKTMVHEKMPQNHAALKAALALHFGPMACRRDFTTRELPGKNWSSLLNKAGGGASPGAISTDSHEASCGRTLVS